jgi:hypothetical protein
MESNNKATYIALTFSLTYFIVPDNIKAMVGILVGIEVNGSAHSLGGDSENSHLTEEWEVGNHAEAETI